MNPLIRLKQTTSVFLVACGLAYFGLLPKVQAVNPPPDGGYAGNNTAEGQDALKVLTMGTNNTALGFRALNSNGTGSNNTATGYFALKASTSADNNTAYGSQALFSNTTGNNNTATGLSALASNTTGHENTAVGMLALGGNQDGRLNTATGDSALLANTADDNTADGSGALHDNTTGNGNTATGDTALFFNTIGNSNTADGFHALVQNTQGSKNTADGFQALDKNTTGDTNIAVGFLAGHNLTTGSCNIDIGNNGVAGESNTIRIGTQTSREGGCGQTATFITGINGTAVMGTPVVVTSDGQLGVRASSQRFKTEVKPMDKASEAILALKPVTFRYRKELDPQGIQQWGLVAEDVQRVNPDLVAFDKEGRPYTVRYDAVNAMLLNEFLKEHLTVQEQGATIARLEKQVEALTAGLQKVSAQLEVSKPAAQTVLNNQ